VTASRQPLVSIVTPTFNAAAFIEETYESIARQSFHDWEWLPVDDASMDETPRLLGEISKRDARVRPIYLSANGGPAVARNSAIETARGEMLAFVDSDDLWLPEKLSSQLRFMRERNSQFSFTAYAPFHGDPRRPKAAIDLKCPDEVSHRDMLLKKATLGCSTVMLARQVVGARRMPLYRSGQDYAFWLEILRSGVNAHRLARVLSLYRVRPGSVSRNKLKKAARQWQIYREAESLSFARAVFCFSQYAVRAVFRS
jgi:teichuronic acid biosynthesis glycosyltransferase TuaG